MSGPLKFIDWMKEAGGRGLTRLEILEMYHAQKEGQHVNLPPKGSPSKNPKKKATKYLSASPCARREQQDCQSAIGTCRWMPSKKSPKTGKSRKAYCRTIKQTNRP